MSHVDVTGGDNRQGLWTLLHSLCLWQLPQGRELRVLPPGTQRIQVEVGQGVKKIPKRWGAFFFVCVKVPLNPRKVFRCKEIFLSKATLPKILKRKKCEKNTH